MNRQGLWYDLKTGTVEEAQSMKPHFRRPLIVSVVSAAIIGLQRAFRSNWTVMHGLSRGLVRPIRLFLATLTGKVSFSVAELLILLFSISLLVWFTVSVVLLVRRPEKLKRGFSMLLTLLSVFLSIYAGVCVLWGVYYYGEDFEKNTGIAAREISVDELESVTAYFAELANDYAGQVNRNEQGLYSGNRLELLTKTKTLYRKTEEKIPGLAGPEVSVKPFFFSKLLSLTDFTGFFFPFTGEANVNMDFPPALFPATAAHELAHQRGVAKEQEANFCAVLASLESGDPDYCYSASLLAYTYLGNALSNADHERWERIYNGLDERIKADFAADREYWKQYETLARSVSNTVYEGFLYSYDQTLGLKSYGACVDLLVSYYLEDALSRTE